MRDVYYLPVFLPKKHSLLKRAVSYLSYNIILLLFGIFNNFKPDVILTSSPPISTAFTAAILAKIKQKKFILDLRDIWPDIGIELGLLNNNFVVNFLKKIEQFIMKSASIILVTAKGDKQNLLKKGIPESKIEIIFNGADTTVFKPLSNEEKEIIREKYHVPKNKLVSIYFGSFNYGMNDIETLAQSLKDLTYLRDKFYLILVGSGDNRKNLLDEIEGKIDYLCIDSLNTDELAKLVAASDLSLIPRKKIEHDTGGNTPVKCFESWAAATPVLLSANFESEISNLFMQCKAGLLVEAGNIGEYKNVLKSIINEPSKLNGLGQSGREFVKKNFDRRIQAEKLQNIIKNLNKD